MLRMYEVTADYRPENESPPKYYVTADNKKEARQKFKAKISWLKILSCEEVTDQTLVLRVFSMPERYILIE